MKWWLRRVDLGVKVNDVVVVRVERKGRVICRILMVRVVEGVD